MKTDLELDMEADTRIDPIDKTFLLLAEIIAVVVVILFTLATIVGCVRARYAPADSVECVFNAGGHNVASCTGHGCDHPEVCKGQ